MSQIITFYSYKGGVGRSMARANVATLLSKWGKKVLMIDWDLEAPGLENFFREYLTDTDWKQQKGVLEWLYAQQNGEAVNWQDWVVKFKTQESKVDLHLLVSGKDNGNYSDLLRDFRPQTITAVNQCAGNSRSRFTPRVQGSQWGNGAMGCAEWTGVRLRDLLSRAGVRAGAVCVQLEGLDRGVGPAGYGSSAYLKSLPFASDMLDEAIVAYAMNGEPLPFLNGFPLRVVVPGYFATYWIKALSVLRVLPAADENFWMKTAYRIPIDGDGTGNTTPAAMAAGGVRVMHRNVQKNNEVRARRHRMDQEPFRGDG